MADSSPENDSALQGPANAGLRSQRENEPETQTSRPATAQAVRAVQRAGREYEALEPEFESLILRPRERGAEGQPQSPAPQEPHSSTVWERLGMAALHLTAAMVGFFFLLRISLAGAVLWFLFLLVAYPVTLAFASRAHRLNHVDLKEIYKVGVEQIPGIGEFLGRILSFGYKKKD
jgi:hypothetical protein